MAGSIFTCSLIYGRQIYNSISIVGLYSGARTNLKVGAPMWREAPEKNFLVVRYHFLALKAQLVVLVNACVMISTVWSVSCLLFYSRSPPCPAICKSWGHVPRAPWSQRHCSYRHELSHFDQIKIPLLIPLLI